MQDPYQPACRTDTDQLMIGKAAFYVKCPESAQPRPPGQPKSVTTNVPIRAIMDKSCRLRYGIGDGQRGQPPTLRPAGGRRGVRPGKLAGPARSQWAGQRAHLLRQPEGAGDDRPQPGGCGDPGPAHASSPGP